jgi:hypothetical protein
MVHTYREERSGGEGPIMLVAVVLAAVGVGFFVSAFDAAMIDAFAGRANWGAAGFAAFLIVLAVTMYESWRRACVEIRLSDDGTCELETKRRVIRLHVNEISAVEYREDDEGSESYTIRYRGGKTIVSWLEQCPDFLSRLQALNPAVDLSSFPRAWPGRQPAEPWGPSVTGFLRCALFPLIVIIFIALVAWQTLSS